ncbi:MAG: GIY-YIG nuclease family protein [Patescibacteria group bacterium]|nr:GIY-YIG nuclease family protein [Patescibacteria group bacterium]MDE1988627.1 GIY-YIG nuclease family protein [Patescibacteria group bacterium]MDE2217917.1 GIY-YIG nuclease family protein [Patescibacteria group bacterium]
MSLITKQSILDAIRRTAENNDGIPLGQGRFEKETGINSYACKKYWSTFGEAQREAGFTANTLRVAHNKEFVFENLIALMRELDKFPTEGDLIVKRNKDPKFPSPRSIKRLGNKKEIAEKISEYAKQKGYNDIVELCRTIIENSNERKDLDNSKIQSLGEVYLFKSGRYYKIGKTNDTVCRGNEIRIQLPEKMDLIHSIKTDDPSGVETYWHKRFESKRMQGEWFDLGSADIKAFKRWRHII